MSTSKEILASNPMPGTTVHISIPATLSSNLEKMQALTKTVLSRLGCGACHSGFDFRFNRELDFSFNEAGELIER